MNNQELIKAINKLKKEQNAIVLAHYYQNDEIQAIADYVGDSYQLSVVAKNTSASVIVFCGVFFMAETAKILSPDKEVILPVKTAGCYMADTIDEKALKQYKEEHPEDVIICYVNTSAKVKALADVCVTSSNALKIIDHYKDQSIMYIPDKNLASYAKYQSHDSLKINHWDGCCNIHDEITVEDIKKAKKIHPNALLMLHPEAPLDTLLEADYIGSTKGMIEWSKQSNNKEFIVGTEKGIMFALMKNNPDKEFFMLKDNLVCPTMKMTTLQDLYNALNKTPNSNYIIIDLDENTIKNANKSLNKMLELSK